MDSLGSLKPSLPISYCSWQVLLTTFTVGTKLMDINICWSTNTGVSMHKKIHWRMFFEYVLNFPAVPHVWLILLGWFARREVSGCTAAVLWSASSRICLKQLTASLCSSHLVFSPSLSSKSRWCDHTVVVTRLQLGRIPVFNHKR